MTDPIDGNAAAALLALGYSQGTTKSPCQPTGYRLAISIGITPDLRFDQVPHAHLAMIDTDLETGKTVFYGQDQSQSILEELLGSSAIPPWFAPVEKDDQFIIDGGILSNLPIESALTLGAAEMIALDLMNDPASLHENVIGATQQLKKLVFAVLKRQACAETALAKAQGVLVYYMQLRSSPPIPIWDFSKHRDLIEIGYEIASKKIPDWDKTGKAETRLPSSDQRRLTRFWSGLDERNINILRQAIIDDKGDQGALMRFQSQLGMNRSAAMDKDD